MITAIRRVFTTEAVQYLVNDVYNSYQACRDFVDEKLWIDGRFASDIMQIEDPVVLTLDGPVIVRHSQWILKGSLGNFYILSNEDFEATYKVITKVAPKINDMPPFPDNKEPFGPITSACLGIESPSVSNMMIQKLDQELEADRVRRMLDITQHSTSGIANTAPIISTHFQSPFELDKHCDAIDSMAPHIWTKLNEKL